VPDDRRIVFWVAEQGGAVIWLAILCVAFVLAGLWWDSKVATTREMELTRALSLGSIIKQAYNGPYWDCTSLRGLDHDPSGDFSRPVRYLHCEYWAQMNMASLTLFRDDLRLALEDNRMPSDVIDDVLAPIEKRIEKAQP
jgi:hypothetical protein